MARIPPADGKVTRRKSFLRMGVGGLLVLVASCAFITWSGLKIWDNLEGNESFRLILGLIRSGTAAERRMAAGSLGWVTRASEIDAAMAALRAALGDEDAEVRAEAGRSLASLVNPSRGKGTAPAEPGLLQKRLEVATRGLVPLLSDPNPGVRASAATGLGLIAEEVTAPPELAAALRDEAAVVRAAAARGLGRFGPDLDREIATLLAMMEHDETNVRTACREALRAAKPSPTLVPTLIGFLKSPDREVRFFTAELLGRIGPEAQAAVPSLFAILKEPIDPEMSRTPFDATEWDPACRAAWALGRIGPSDAVTAALIELLSSGIPAQRGIPERRLSAARALALMGPRAAGAAPALIAALNEWLDSEKDLPGGYEMVKALGRIGPSSASAADAVTALVRVLGSPYRSARLGAAEALGKFGHDASASLSRLRSLQGDSDRSVRDAAAKSLAALESQ